MDSTQALIARLEAADEGSRELDVSLALAVGAPQAYFNKFNIDIDGRPHGGFADVDGPECYVDKATWGGGGRSWTAPLYTTSLDAALTLVPANCWLSIEWAGGSRKWPVVEIGGVIGTIQAKTAALALCTAALKARQTAPVPPGKAAKIAESADHG